MENVKVTFTINGYAKISRLPMDGILAKLYFTELKRNGKFNGDYFQRLPFLEMDAEGFYHISAPIVEKRSLDNATLHKGFDVGLFKTLGGKTNASMYRAGSGTYKMWAVDFEREWVERTIIYLRGDGETIERLLSNLTHLGKKSAHGWGRIEKTEIEEISEDFSVVKEGVLMRHVPYGSRYERELGEEYGVALRPLTHPYWDRGRETYCLIPN